MLTAALASPRPVCPPECSTANKRHTAQRGLALATYGRYILIGAAVVGGALTLFIEDTMEGCLTASKRDYRELLEQQVSLMMTTHGHSWPLMTTDDH